MTPRFQPRIRETSTGHKPWRAELKRVWAWSEKKASRIVRWLVFVVVVAILSFAVASLWQWLRGDPVDFSELLSGGEGFLVTIAITADALGRAADSKTLHSSRALACALVLGAALTGFVFTISGREDHKIRITKAMDIVRKEERRISESPNIPEAERLKSDEAMLVRFEELLDQEAKQPYNAGRIARMSLTLACCGFVCSFWVILLQEEQ